MPEKFALALEISPRQQRKMLAKEAKYNHPITPNYDVLRIFASEQDDLDQLVEQTLKVIGKLETMLYSIILLLCL